MLEGKTWEDIQPILVNTVDRMIVHKKVDESEVYDLLIAGILEGCHTVWRRGKTKQDDTDY